MDELAFDQFLATHLEQLQRALLQQYQKCHASFPVGDYQLNSKVNELQEENQKLRFLVKSLQTGVGSLTAEEHDQGDFTIDKDADECRASSCSVISEQTRHDSSLRASSGPVIVDRARVQNGAGDEAVDLNIELGPPFESHSRGKVENAEKENSMHGIEDADSEFVLREGLHEFGVACTHCISNTSSEDKLEVENFDEDEVARNPCIAHPNSPWRMAWDIVGMFVLAFEVVMIPLDLSFKMPQSKWYAATGWVTLLYWTMDIPMSLTVGFQEQGFVILSAWRVFVRYLRTWMVLDFAVVGLDWLSVFIGAGSELAKAAQLVRLGKTLRCVRVLRVLRLLRIAKLQKVGAAVMDQLQSEYQQVLGTMVKHVFVLICLNHLIACAWFAVGDMNSNDSHAQSWVKHYNLKSQSLSYRYTTSLHWSLSQFTPASSGVQPQNGSERLFAVMVLLLALCVFSSFVSSITSGMTALRNLSVHREQMQRRVSRFLRKQQISDVLGIRITKFIMEVNPSNSVDHADSTHILNQLSVPLRKELQYELFSPSLEFHPFLKKMLSSCADMGRQLCETAAHPILVSHSDALFNKGTHSDGMYILKKGVMQYQLHREIFHMNPGQWCSEPSLWTTWFHVGTMIAATICELIHIRQKAFQDVVQNYPAQRQILLDYAEQLVADLNKARKLNPLGLTDLPSQRALIRESSKTLYPSLAVGVEHGRIFRRACMRICRCGYRR